MAIKKIKISPRQKMINLMYVVLMAMLALNISTEVLNGFSIVEESLNRTTGNSTKENEAIYRELEQIMRKNPAKARVWFQRATTGEGYERLALQLRPRAEDAHRP